MNIARCERDKGVVEMFGDDDDNQTDQAQNGAPTVTPAYPVSNAAAADVNDSAGSAAGVALPKVPDTASNANNSQPADNDAELDSLAGDEATQTLAQLEAAQHVEEPAEDTPRSSESTPPASDTGSDELLGIKQQALQQLSPLVGHLDQTPEERFKTTMMMIQAADNKELVKVAYEAAQSITDEKIRAQALLDIINEINYFTQQATETD